MTTNPPENSDAGNAPATASPTVDAPDACAGQTAPQAQAAQGVGAHARGLLYSVCENIDCAVKKAAGKASSRAAEAVPKVRRAVARGAYGGSYAAAYGVVLGTALARRLLTDNGILESVKDGISAGRTAASQRAATPAGSPAAAAASVHPQQGHRDDPGPSSSVPAPAPA